MSRSQRVQNPDVNSYNPNADPGENSGGPADGSNDIEPTKERDVIPVPPDATPPAPIEEPPGSEGTPVGDVDDSPKRIAS